MKNYFTASLAIAVAQAIQMQVDQAATCAASGDISLSSPPNQVIRIDSALGPDRGTEWYDDDDCIPLTEEQAHQRGRWVGLWNGQQVPETLLDATRYNMWAQYRCPDDPENKAYWLNVARAERCLNAWADVDGDCSTQKSMRYSIMTADLKPFRLNQWDGDYSDPQIRTDAMHLGGLTQNSWEAVGECEDGKFRWAANDFYQQINDGERPLFTSDIKSQECPFFEFCWQDTWCTSTDGPGQAVFTEQCSSIIRLAPHDYTANGEDERDYLPEYTSTEGVFWLDEDFVRAGPVTLTLVEGPSSEFILFGCRRLTFSNGIDTVTTDLLGGPEGCLVDPLGEPLEVQPLLEANFSQGAYLEVVYDADGIFVPIGFAVVVDGEYRTVGFPYGDVQELIVLPHQRICGVTWWRQSWLEQPSFVAKTNYTFFRPTICETRESP